MSANCQTSILKCERNLIALLIEHIIEQLDQFMDADACS